MIKTEYLDIDGHAFRKTYSDSGFLIERDGIQYSEAIDPIGFEDRVYSETDELMEGSEEESELEENADEVIE